MSEKSSIVDRIPAAGIVLVRRSRLVTSRRSPARTRASSMTASMPSAWLARTVPSPSCARSRHAVIVLFQYLRMRLP